MSIGPGMATSTLSVISIGLLLGIIACAAFAGYLYYEQTCDEIIQFGDAKLCVRLER